MDKPTAEETAEYRASRDKFHRQTMLDGDVDEAMACMPQEHTVSLIVAYRDGDKLEMGRIVAIAIDKYIKQLVDSDVDDWEERYPDNMMARIAEERADRYAA